MKADLLRFYKDHPIAAPICVGLAIVVTGPVFVLAVFCWAVGSVLLDAVREN